jgi:glutathione S-transferase
MLDEALLWDNADSPFCLKARICLQLKSVPFRRVTVTVARRKELQRLNPLGKVPVLVDGGEVIIDSSAIARHLETRHPEPPLLPADPAARAFCALVEDWADEALYFLVCAFKWLNPENRAAALENTLAEIDAGMLRPLVARQLVRKVTRRYRAWGYGPEHLAEFVERMRDALGVIGALLDGKAYFLGRTPSLADVAVFVQVKWMQRYVEGRLVDEVPGLRAWLARLEELPAIADALSA